MKTLILKVHRSAYRVLGWLGGESVALILIAVFLGLHQLGSYLIQMHRG